MPEGISALKNIKFKAIITLVALPVVWIISKVIGFPILFRWLFAIYIVVMFLFFLLIDAPAMQRRKKGALSIFVTFVIASIVYTFLGIVLPQYDPKVEIEKIKKLTTGRIEIGAIKSPEKLIETGMDVYDLYECYNCHKLKGKGGAKTRGTELDEVGWESDLYIKESLLNPMALITEEFDKPKLRDAMPDYYSEEFNEGEYKALIAYLKSLRPSADKMPRDWWTNQRIILEGKMIYDGIANPSVNCAACHGRDGKSVMSGARELKDANAKGSEKTEASRKKPLKEWSDKDWFNSIKIGVPETAMLGWGQALSDSDIWKLTAYIAALSGSKGITQENLKAFIETERGKTLTAYIDKEDKRKDNISELEEEIEGN